MRSASVRWIVASASGLLLAAPAIAQTTGLEDMVGARAGQAENGVRARGYAFVRAQQGDDRSYTYWWNDARRQCVTIATMDGRYTSVTPTLPPDCGKSAKADGNGNDPYRNPPAPTAPQYGGRDDRGMDDRGDRGYQGALVDGRRVTIGLVCFGDGSRDGLASGSQWRWNPRTERYEYGTYTEARRQIFDTSLMVQIWNGGGRIRLPRSLIPPINSRGDNGWWDLTDVRAGPAMITATYRLNGLNKPRVTIDRRSGRVIVQGLSNYGFRGACEQIGSPNKF